MPSSHRKRSTSTRTIAIVFSIVAILAILVTIAYLGIHKLVDADMLAREITESVSDATDGLYEVEIEEIEFSLTRGSFTAINTVLRPVSARADALREAGELPRTRYEIEVPRVEARGVGRIALIRGRGLHARDLRLIDPVVTLTLTPSPPRDPPPSRDDEEPSVHQNIRGELPEMRFNTLEVVNARLEIDRQGRERRFFDRLDSLYLSFTGVVVDSVSAAREGRLLFSDNVDLHVPPQTRFSADSLYRYRIGEINGSSRNQRLTIASLAYAPTVSDDRYFALAGYRTDRIRIETGAIELTGAQYRRFMERGEIVIGLIDVEAFEIDVFTDLRLPEPPVRDPVMPDEHFRRIDRYVNIDTTRVRGGSIAYHEIAQDGDRPGTVRFENPFATVYNLTNDESEMTHATPAVIDARAQLYGQGDLRAHIRYPLLDPGLTLSYSGTLGAMEIEAFNETFEPIEGVRIVRGELDSLSFDVQATNGTATGYVRPMYRDLAVEMRDKVDATRGLREHIAGFIANVFVIPDHNVPEDGEPADAGSVNHTRAPEDPFFKFLWESLRSGLFEVLGV